MKPPVCFHGWDRCAYCWDHRTGKPPSRRHVRRRCAACGKVKARKLRSIRANLCGPCGAAGLLAPTLF